jgi:hypothetical protein
MTLTIFFQIVSAVAALVAAVLWWRSAAVPVPDFTIIGTYSPQANQIAPIAEWARDTASLSGWAASFAAGSAVTMAVSIFTQMRGL